MKRGLSIDKIIELRKIGNIIIKEVLGERCFVFVYTCTQKTPEKICVSVQKLKGPLKSFYYGEIYKEEKDVTTICNNPEQFFREIALRVALGA
jgi:hypothetical protein